MELVTLIKKIVPGEGRQHWVMMVLGCLLFPGFSLGQQLSIERFRLLENDLSARVHQVKYDQNGEKCAIIKVVTKHTNLVWEGDILGITAVDYQTGEYWLYVPHGARRLTIKHANYGIIRNYSYPIPIKEATTYEMVLKAQKNHRQSSHQIASSQSQWLLVESEPSNAEVYIDDQYKGTTPFSAKVSLGEHSYSVSKSMYQTSGGLFTATRQQRTDLKIRLEPRFGFANITSVPESRASIVLNGLPLESQTPYTSGRLPIGSYRVKVSKPFYLPKITEFQVKAGDTTGVEVALEPNYAFLRIKTTPQAEILINEKMKGLGLFNGRITPGIHFIEGSRERHVSDKREIQVQVGDTVNIHLAPTPITGVLEINSKPFKAGIFIDGKPYGTTPATLQNMLIGEHLLELKKENYQAFSKKIYIKRDTTLRLNEKLMPGASQVYVEQTHSPPQKVEPKATPPKRFNDGPGNLLYSVLIPGLGVGKVSDRQGWNRTFAVYGLLAAGWGATKWSDAEYDKYHSAILQDEIDEHYENADVLNKLSYTCFATGLLIWLYDIYWVAEQGFQNRRARSYKANISMHYNELAEQPMISLQITF